MRITGSDGKQYTIEPGADLSSADLSQANLSGALLSGANLSGAKLIDADLNGANLGGARLINTDLCGANLANALLSGANLGGAKLIDADLNGANLVWVRYDGQTVFPEGFEPSTDMRFIGPNSNLSGANSNGVTSDDKTAPPEGFDPPDPSRIPSTSSSPLTGIGLLRVLAWIWLILCPIGGIVFWVEWAELKKVLGFDESMLGLELFLAATLSGVVTFAVFLVLCTIAENLIAIKNAVTSNTQQSS